MTSTAGVEQAEAAEECGELTELAVAALDVAARQIATRSGRHEIVVVRPSGAVGIQQAVALCRKLTAREIPARVIAPAEAAGVLHGPAPSIATVIDLDPADTWVGAQLAAEFDVPLLVPARGELRRAQRSCDAMSLAAPGDNGMAALQADIVAREAGPDSVTVEVAGRVVQILDAAVRVRV